MARAEPGTVVVNGCFDVLHAAHVHLLQQARALGDRLIVLVNSDRSVKERKGKGRPYNCFRDRAAVLQALRSVDAVIEFDDEAELRELIREIRPAVMVKGAEYRGKEITGEDAVRATGGRVVFVRSLTEQRSTSSGHSASSPR